MTKPDRPVPGRSYTGHAASREVTVTLENGETRPLARRHDLANHSPDGFAWGYGGSGPSQLALAMLADCLGNDQMAIELYHDFKWRVVAGLSGDWTLTDEQVIEAIGELPENSPLHPRFGEI